MSAVVDEWLSDPIKLARVARDLRTTARGSGQNRERPAARPISSWAIFRPWEPRERRRSPRRFVTLLGRRQPPSCLADSIADARAARYNRPHGRQKGVLPLAEPRLRVDRVTERGREHGHAARADRHRRGGKQHAAPAHPRSAQIVPGVDIVGVVNRTAESTARVAKEFDIPRTSIPNWPALIADPEIDAVVIGTWPNLHCELTCAALEARKHVLTEARMARNADRGPSHVRGGPPISRSRQANRPEPVRSRAKRLCARADRRRFLGRNSRGRRDRRDGRLLEVRCAAALAAGCRRSAGTTCLSMGILHETVLRWAPPPTRVFAQAATFGKTRPAADGAGRLPGHGSGQCAGRDGAGERRARALPPERRAACSDRGTKSICTAARGRSNSKSPPSSGC